MVEEAAATVLELHEANLAAAANKKADGQSDVRSRHEQLMQQAKGADG